MRKLVAIWLGLISCAFLEAADIGKDWGIEREFYTDTETGVRIAELTRTGTVSDNLYFHFSNFSADNHFLIFVSNRSGSSQLFRAEVETGRLVQLTDAAGTVAHGACPDPTNARRLYFLRGPSIIALDILDFSERRVCEIPPPHLGGLGQPTLTKDGKRMVVHKRRDQNNWEIGFVDTETGEYRTVTTVGFPINHVQHSPVDPIIFYAWETGGYAPQRSWLVNDDGTANRPFYARTDPKTWFTPLKEWVTHEAWVNDTGDMTMVNDKQGVMLVHPDGTSRMICRGEFWHAAARPDGKFLVVDDNAGRLWLMETASGKKRLLTTGLREKVHTVHPHASFDRRGRYVEFHTGRTHETVALIDLETLPPFDWTK
jgi:oligogalacturonide lyase